MAEAVINILSYILLFGAAYMVLGLLVALTIILPEEKIFRKNFSELPGIKTTFHDWMIVIVYWPIVASLKFFG